MTRDAEIVIGIRGDIEGGKRVQRTLDDIDRSGRQATSSTKQLRAEMSSMNSAAAALSNALGRVATVYAAFQGAKGLMNISDEYTNINNKLKLVTDSTEQLTEVQTDLVAISDRTFTSLSSNVTLYSRLYNATRDLNSSQEDLLKATEAIQQTFRISGATAAEAANSAVQLAQGLAAGALRGDEFRSVSEQNIKLLNLLTEQLGVTRGELKQMADEGQLTAEKIFPILVNNVEELNAEASDIAPTFEQAFAKIKEKFAQGIDETIRAKSEFNSLGQAISDLGPIAKTFGSATVGNVVAGLSDIVTKLKEAVGGFTELNMKILGLEQPKYTKVDWSNYKGYTQYDEGDFNRVLGGSIPEPPTPGKKPTVPDDWFAKQAEAREKAAKDYLEDSQRAQKSIDDVTNSLKFQLAQLKRNDTEQEIYNNLRQAGVSIDSAAGQEIANLTRQYEDNSAQMEKSKRIIDGVAGTTEGFFKTWLTGADRFKGAVKGMIGQLADLAFQMSVIEPIKRNLLGGSSSGGGFGGILGSLFGSFGGSSYGSSQFAARALNAAPGLFGPGFDDGGSMTIGGRGGIDQNQLSLNGAPIARVGRGETLSISPGNKGGSAPIIVNQTLNLSMGVTAEVAAQLSAMMPLIEKQTQAAIEQAQARGIQAT